jgi:hypothetical protein
LEENPMHQRKSVSVEELPENTALAIYELIGGTFRNYSEVLYIRVPNVTDDGKSMGGIEITIRKTAFAGSLPAASPR